MTVSRACDTVVLHALGKLIGSSPKCTVSLKERFRTSGVLDSLLEVLPAVVRRILLSLPIHPPKDTDYFVFCCDQLRSFLSILEHATFVNNANQKHLLSSPSLMTAILQHLHSCQGYFNNYRNETSESVTSIPTRKGSFSTDKDIGNQASVTIVECFLQCLKVLVNLTNGNELACNYMREQEGIETIFTMLINLEIFPSPNLFDIQIMLIGLLSNIVENNERNRVAIRELDLKALQLSTGPSNGLTFLANLFLKKSKFSIPTRSVKEKSETESNVFVSYLALLLGLLSCNPLNRKLILTEFPEHSFRELIEIIESFIMFQLESGILSQEGYESFSSVLRSLKQFQQELRI